MRGAWAAWASGLLVAQQLHVLAGTSCIARGRGERHVARAALQRWAGVAADEGTLSLLRRAWACAALRAWALRCRLRRGLRRAARAHRSLLLTRSSPASPALTVQLARRHAQHAARHRAGGAGMRLPQPGLVVRHRARCYPAP